eukprot:scaffold239650_cov39-Attheya_sp.AAC.1
MAEAKMTKQKLMAELDAWAVAKKMHKLTATLISSGGMEAEEQYSFTTEPDNDYYCNYDYDYLFGNDDDNSDNNNNNNNNNNDDANHNNDNNAHDNDEEHTDDNN